MRPTAGNLDTLRKIHDNKFHEYDHNHNPDPDLYESVIETQESYIAELENKNRNLEQSVSELKLEANYWKRRAEELESNISSEIERRQIELAQTAFDDRNDAEAKRLCHADGI